MYIPIYVSEVAFMYLFIYYSRLLHFNLIVIPPNKPNLSDYFVRIAIVQLLRAFL